MGNHGSCCFKIQSYSDRDSQYRYRNGQSLQNQQQYVNQSFPLDDVSASSRNFLAHISEREQPEGAFTVADPSTHPTAKTMFIERSKSDMRLRDLHHCLHVLDSHSSDNHSRLLIKSNSCSTIFLDDSTITQPNLKNTIKCISLAIYYHITDRSFRGQERLMEIFEERLHPITRDPIPSEYISRDPEHRQIYRFVRTLFHSAQLTAECAIITLVYIERLLNYAEIDLCPSNWRRVVLGAIMLSSKVWDDQAVWNVDYCQILHDSNVDDMNELERQFLECLAFNINVPSSVYAKYYYDLRTLAMANNLPLHVQPLYKDRARKLEALSQVYGDKIGPDTKSNYKRSTSAEKLPPKESRSLVIIP